MAAERIAELLDCLTMDATNDAFSYAHAWRQGDGIVWDNRQTLHWVGHNCDLAEKHLMHRIILKGAVLQ